MNKKYFWLVYGFMVFLVACQPTSVPETETVLPTPDTPTPTTVPFNLTFEIIGEPEVVFLWQTDRCEDRQYADLPARAIRTADGRIQLYISSVHNYRLVGDDFNSLTPDCEPVLLSDLDRNPANYNHSEWMGAPYTIDGETIYAIIHQEFHGDQAGSIWQADGEFNLEPEAQSWTYQSWNGASLSAMTFRASKNERVGFQALCLIGPQWMHPDVNCDPNRTWTSPIAGTVTIHGRTYDLDVNGGDGVDVQILKGEEVLWSAGIENGDTTGATYNLEIDVQEGDQIHFRVDARSNANNDSTYFNPGINIGEAPCPAERHDMCTLISLTYAISTDGGATFTQPPAPEHLVANFPYPYDADWMRAIWQPSNIVQNPNDGYYYMLVQFDEHPQDYSSGAQGMCALRTQTLDDPTSWRAWDGTGFNMRFINPYIDTAADPADHTCVLVSPEIGALTYGLSYNTYFEKFIAVGVGFEGFYFSLSDDLVHWSPRQFIMEAAQTFAPGAEPPYFPYPTLIDHDSSSMSFDTTGQTAWLYFARFNRAASSSDTDLLRVQIRFSK